MNLSLIIACIVIVLALIIFPLIISYKAEKKETNEKMNGIKLKNMGINLITKIEKILIGIMKKFSSFLLIILFLI